MKRRDLFKQSLTVSALAAIAAHEQRAWAAPGPGSPSGTPATPATPAAPAAKPPGEFPKAPGLTKSVAEFILATKYSDLPHDVIDLGKKSILDGFGLALAGSVSAMGPLVRQYVQSFGQAATTASIIG